MAQTEVTPARPALLAGRRVAVVHEWVGATGGAEQVFRHIAGAVPHATRFVLWKELGVPDAGLRESWLARTPLRRAKAVALPLMPLVWRTLTRERFDVVISSSHAFAHMVRLGGGDGARHLSYVHTPARYVWSPAFDRRGANPLLALPRGVLKAADVRLSRHVDSYAANSHEVQARIRRYWGRDAVVIHPPVDVEFFAAAPAADRAQPRDYLLAVGRWVAYKNFDLVIAIADAAGLPLVLAGCGPQEGRLRRLAAAAGVPVRFDVRPDRAALRRLYWGARALVFPAHEDFGIVAVEAQVCGTPVVGLRRGGLTETVADGETGLLTDSLEPRDYVALLRRLPELTPGRLPIQAARFSHHEFAAGLARWVDGAAG